MITTEASPTSRRHDLDALRATAMLLGIALHAALSFAPIPWVVQDTRQNAVFGLFVAAVHGFRMPLFFLLSGFFTAMLWRRRGLKSLLWQRFRRVFLPLLLGLFTIIPALNWIMVRAIAPQPFTAVAAGAADIWTAARQGHLEVLQELAAAGANLNEPDPALGLTPLFLAASSDQDEVVEWLVAQGANLNSRNKDAATPLHGAALYGHAEIVRGLLQHGADVNLQNRDGSTPLHAAALFGQAEAAEHLLAHGADTTMRNHTGQTPAEVTAVDWGTTSFLARILGMRIVEAEVRAGRERIVKLLQTGNAGAVAPLAAQDGLASVTIETGEAAPAPAVKNPGRPGWLNFLQFAPVFHHLWFLWFLCWLVAGFALYAGTVDRLQCRGLPGGWLLSPSRYLWLIPLTMIPQWFMGMASPSFGPDTSMSLLPPAPILAYYAIFFGVGVVYFDSNDTLGRVGRHWWAVAPVALVLVFPLGLAASFGTAGLREHPGWASAVRVLSVTLQVSYAWMMTFAMTGFFRRLLTRESPAIRYMSDSSYWLYLTHLPLIIAAQWLVRDWSWPAPAKFLLVSVSVTGFLLVIYQLLVRYTWLGRLLNGPRTRAGRRVASASAQENPMTL